MHLNLTKHGRFCKQNNQLPTKSHDELKDNSITFWMIRIDQNNRVLNLEQWHDSKMKHLIWGDLTMYAKMTCEHVVELVKISTYLARALHKDFDETWWHGNVLVDGVE